MVSMTALAAVAVLTFGGWNGEKGNGTIKDEARQVAEFTAVEVGGGFHVEVSVGPERKVTVTADENLLPLIRTEVKNGVLDIETRKSVRSSNPMKVVVVTPKLDRVDASGGVRMSVNAAANKKFGIEASGGATILVNGLDSEDLTVDFSGGVEAKLAGKARNARYDFTGGVDVDAQALEVENAKIDASGGVDARLAVSNAITGEASGGVKVRVKGRPSVNVASSGGSSVRTE